MRIAVLAVLLLALAGVLAAAQTPPNIVVIFADDLGYGDLGCFGAEDIPTPRCDALAREGARLTDFYVPQALCSPSRAALLTGRYPQRVVRTSGVYMPTDTGGMRTDVPTLAQVLADAGYATGIVGKWHLGHAQPYLPTSRGFASWLGIPYSNDMTPNEKPQHPPLPLMDGERVVERGVDQRRLPELYADACARFIADHRDRPFLLYYAPHMPHDPYINPPRFAGASRRGDYGDAVASLDWTVGRVLDALAGQGVAQRTLVILTSDNGAQQQDASNRGSNAPFSGAKQTAREGGVRVPALVRWPGVAAAGSTIAEPCGTIDLLPTLCAVASAAVPEGIDGIDIGPALRGQALPPRPLLVFDKRGPAAVRMGRFKLWLGSGALHDLAADPAEAHDVAAQHADEVAAIRAAAEPVLASLRRRD